MPESSWPAPTPRDEMLARVVTRGRRIQMVNRILIGLAVAGAATVGVVGVALGTSGAIDLFGEDSGGGAVVPVGVDYSACPADAVLGQLRSGDRVYLTGRDESGEWLEMRSPVDQIDRVWVRAEVVDPDGALDLPVVSCDVTELSAAVSGVATATTTAPVEGEELPPEEATTTTAPPGPTPTTVAPGPTPPPPPPPPPPPAPVIGTISRSNSTIYEADVPGQCVTHGNQQVTSLISVTISNASSATMSWSVAGTQGSKPMQLSGSTFSAVLGEFAETTVPYTAPYFANATVTVTATGPGGSSQKSTTVRIEDCTFG